MVMLPFVCIDSLQRRSDGSDRKLILTHSWEEFKKKPEIHEIILEWANKHFSRLQIILTENDVNEPSTNIFAEYDLYSLLYTLYLQHCDIYAHRCSSIGAHRSVLIDAYRSMLIDRCSSIGAHRCSSIDRSLWPIVVEFTQFLISSIPFGAYRCLLSSTQP